MTTLDRTVTAQDLATTLYPTVRKPPWLATARLLQWCELAAMEGIDGTAVGVAANTRHYRRAVLSEVVTVTANRVRDDGDRTHWYVTAHRGPVLLASADLVFVVLDPARLAAAGEFGAWVGGHRVGDGEPTEQRCQCQQAGGRPEFDLVSHGPSVPHQA
jgi:predicted thioesterase